MLEIKNVTKVYKSKHAKDVIALNNVSIKFGDRGLIFLLGKSGSGKSTVLNAIGGLDSIDEGEIIINGKSSNTFTQKDFDAYRNTYVGFIFQEYNVLPEFTVAKNIGLALELQGKKANPETINDILKQVDLVGYGNRKPNQLSGGQKQRIAIARALVKNPEIIMADEPTGALDSKTGRQVFETLRKLGNEKLVIVVSHDRESAEQYADRIIELKDGKVISDKVKRTVTPKVMGKNISLVQSNLVHVKGGQLSLQDKLFLDKLISNVKGDIYLSANPEINEEIKRTAKITESGKSTVLVETEPSDIKRNARRQEFKLINGKLRNKDAVKMGASSLKTKKGKLVVSIFLAIIAMALFGFADTMAAFNAGNAMYQSIKNSDNQVFCLQKQVNTTQYGSDYSYDYDAYTNDAELETLSNTYKSHKFLPVYGITLQSRFYKTIESLKYEYYLTRSKGFYLTSQDYSDFNLKLLSGSYPTTKYEVAISDLQFELYKKLNYRTSSNTEKVISNYSDIIGKTLGNSDEYRITGVINTNLTQKQKESILAQRSEDNLINDMFMLSLLDYSFHLGLFFGAQPTGVLSDYDIAQTYFSSTKYENEFVYYQTNGNSLINSAIMKENLQTLSNNQVIAVYLIRQSGTNSYSIPKLGITGTSAENVASKFNQIFSNKNNFDNYFGNANIVEDNLINKYNVEVVGAMCTTDTNFIPYGNNMMLCGNCTDSLSLSIARLGSYLMFITKLNSDDADYQFVCDNTKFGATENRFMVQSEASSFFSNFYSTIASLSKIFFYVGLFFALFSTLLIMSFIGNSISYKKKEIGVLRALGATGRDVYRIFTFESLIITGIVFVFSVLIVGIGSLAANLAIKANVGVYLSLFSFGIRQVLILAGVCLLIGLVASLFPTLKISKMKPIDAIQDRK